MTIGFDQARWKSVRESYRRWWAGELDRPIVAVHLHRRDPGRPAPAAPVLSQATCHELDIPADAIIDRLDYELSRIEFLGDAYPRINMDCFGPGVLSAMMGARLDNSTGRVWFHPAEDLSIDRLHFRFDPENVWFRRIVDLYRAGRKRWGGQVLMSMPDLGGNLDILSTFRPAERLLLDLIDAPEEVERLTWEGHEAWHECYGLLAREIPSDEVGYTDWAGLLSDRPAYMLQCDFCYMIGPEMFSRFVLPELVATTQRLGRAFYHLDGAGQLVHLDALLSFKELAGIQWVPGPTLPDPRLHLDVTRRILAAGKRAQITWCPSLAVLEQVIEQLGSGRGIQCQPWPADLDATGARAILGRLGYPC